MTGSRDGYEILTPAEMYEADRRNGDSLRLMERAGMAVVQEIKRRYRKCAVAVLCGPGNNGGDGFVIARLLKASRWPVTAYMFGERTSLKGDAARMAAKWTGPVRGAHGFENSKLIVDAIYGAGLSRDFPAELAQHINGSGCPIVAVDVPSGLDGLTGQPRGAAVKADVTVTFYRKKPAHVLYPGRALCGEIIVADIGIRPLTVLGLDVRLWENSPPAVPSPDVSAHKYSRGGTVFYSGDELSGGAARLAAMAAARIGAGAVTLCGTKDALGIHAAHVTSIMLKTPVQIDDRKCRAACIGPGHGGGDGTRQQVLALLQKQYAMVLDADALTSFEQTPDALFQAIKLRGSASVVLTPHEGEFARLFSAISRSSENKVQKARAAAQISGAIVLYKGPDTVIAHPDGRAVVNTNGSAKLATAGSGDVLAGIITGLMAQGMDALDAASAGAFLHAEAAEKSPRRAPMAEDLIAALA